MAPLWGGTEIKAKQKWVRWRGEKEMKDGWICRKRGED